MLKIIATAVVISTIVSTSSLALPPDVELEVRRLEQRIARVAETNEQLLKDVRLLQRSLTETTKEVEKLRNKNTEMVDAYLELQNVHIANLRAGQKALYEQIPALDWGTGEEGCADISAKHQQIETVNSADNTKVLRFLCFDGKAIHLSTELTTPLD